MNHQMGKILELVLPMVASMAAWWAGELVVRKYPPHQVFRSVRSRISKARTRR